MGPGEQNIIFVKFGQHNGVRNFAILPKFRVESKNLYLENHSVEFLYFLSIHVTRPEK